MAAGPGGVESELLIRGLPHPENFENLYPAAGRKLSTCLQHFHDGLLLLVALIVIEINNAKGRRGTRAQTSRQKYKW